MTSFVYRGVWYNIVIMATNQDKARWAREYYLRKKLGLSQPVRGENLRKHGLTKSPEHRSWLSMMTRCVWSGPERSDWMLYQGKGITICEKWLEFINFLADMGPKPTSKHTLDRIDSDGNYEPANCRWATPKQQARNWKHRNHLYRYKDENLTLSEWAERLGMARESLRDRISSGWPIEKAISTPPVRKRERNKYGSFKAFGN
jgi:hypothetical protein